MVTPDVLLLKSGYARAGTANPVIFGDMNPNILLLLSHYFPGIVWKENIAFLRPIISGGLDKSDELVSRYLWKVLSDNIIVP